MLIGRERAVGNISAGVGLDGIRTVGINERRLDECQSDGLAGLPAGAGDIHCGPWRVVSFVGLDSSEAVEVAALERNVLSVFAARDEQQSVLADRTAGRGGARGGHETGSVESP